MYTDFPDSPGIYQIYGSSPLYGIDTLLYIGQALSLKHRLKTHLGDKENVIGRQANLSCRYAEVPLELLDAAEQILIVMYKPSFNSLSLRNIKSGAKEKPYYIQNHGERGILNYENTNYYFLTDEGKVLAPDDSR